MLQHNAVGATAAENKGGGGEGGMAQCALPFDNDDIGVLDFERFNDGCF
jgi:hypothetical protein